MRYASASKNLPSIEPEIQFPHHSVVLPKYLDFNWKGEIKSEKYSDKNLKIHFSRNEKGWYAGQVWQFSLIWEPCCFDQRKKFLEMKKADACMPNRCRHQLFLSRRRLIRNWRKKHISFDYCCSGRLGFVVSFWKVIYINLYLCRFERLSSRRLLISKSNQQSSP